MGQRSATLLMVQIGLLFVSTVESIFTSRILGPELRGILNVLINAQILLITAFSLSLGTSYTVKAAKQQERVGELTSNALFASALIGGLLVASFLIFPGIYMDSLFRNVEYHWALLVMVIVLPSALFAFYWNSIMVGINRVILLSVIGGVTSIVGTSVTIVALVFFHIGVGGIVGIWISNSLISDVVYLWLLVRVERPVLRINLGLLRDSARFGLTKHIGNTSSYLVLRMDAIVLNILWGATAVGFYSLAISVAERIWFVVGVLGAVSYPRIAAELDNSEAVRITCTVCRHTLFLGILMSFGIAAVSPLAIHVLYTDRYLPAVRPLLFLLPGIIVYQVVRALDAYFTAQLSRPHIPSAIAVVTLLASVPTYIFLIRPFGAAGAAVATSLVYCLQAGLAAAVFLHMTESRLVDIAVLRRGDLLAYATLLRSTGRRLVVARRRLFSGAQL